MAKEKPSKILDFLFPHRGLRRALEEIQDNQKKIMATQQEEAARIAAFTVQVRKAIDEILKRIADLQEAVNNAPASEELTAAVAALGVAVQAADDIVPDAPPPTP